MSLRGFHLVFIILAESLALLIGIWGLTQPGDAYLLLGASSLALAVVLAGYGAWFIKKLKRGKFS